MFVLSFALLAACAVTWRLYTTYNYLSKIPRDIAWVGRDRWSPLSYLRTQIRSIWNTPLAISQAYDQYSKQGLLAVLPLPLSRPEIIVPPSLIRWMISRPERVLSPSPVHYEITGAKYAFLDGFVDGDVAVYNVLRSNMNRQLPKMVGVVMSELAPNTDRVFGMDPGTWKEVRSHDLVKEVISQVSARIILGAPLCYNKELTDALTGLVTCVVPGALLLRLFPTFLRPWARHLTTLPNRMYGRRVMGMLGPHITERISTLAAMKAQAGGSLKGQTLPQEDMITWLVAEALSKEEPLAGMVDRIASRVFVAYFAANETTVLTMSNVLFDLCASAREEAVWEGLAEEGNRILPTLGETGLGGVNSLVRADSALKETLRLRTSIKALAHEVTAPDGLVLEPWKVRLPRGARIAVSSWGIHRDDNLYPDGSRYRAFRFVPNENGSTAATTSEKEESDQTHLMVSANENYLPFGLGRHSCPGRHFASVELKLFLAYLAVHYEVRLVEGEERPRFVSVGHFPIPPLGGRLMVRRKVRGG